MKRKIPPYYVINWNVNCDNIVYYDVMPYLVSCWKEEKKRKHKLWNDGITEINVKKDTTKMPEKFDEFKKFITKYAMYRYWARCEYETIVTGWPVGKHEHKLDVYEQIKMNIDVVTKHFMDYINS